MLQISNYLFSEIEKLIELNELDKAENSIRKILLNQPKNIDALRYLSYVYLCKGKFKQSLNYLNKGLKIYPDNPTLLNYKGNILFKLKNYLESLECYKKITDNLPEEYEAWINTGNVYFELENYESAAECINTALKINSSSYQAWSNLGNIYCRLKKYDFALNCHLNAIKLNPSCYQCWSNLGFTYKLIGKTNDAILSYQKSLLIKPDYSDAHENIAIIYLEDKNFSNAWDHYQFRWGSQNFDTEYLKTVKPLWNGKIDKCTLCIWAEQGIGDQILFSSFLEYLKGRNLKICIAINEKLVNIFKRSFPSMDIYSIDNINKIEYDYHLPLGDLPKLLFNENNNFYNERHPYILDNDNLSKDIFSLLNQAGLKKLKCGLSIKSTNKRYGNYKSISTDFLGQLLLEKFDYINIDDSNDKNNQPTSDGKSKLYSFNNFDFFNNIDLLVSTIKNCDFIITVSNTTAHLAGSMGKTTFLLLPHSVGKFWYWNHQTEDQRSLWYPSVRIFRQNDEGDWGETINRLNNYLKKIYNDY